MVMARFATFPSSSGGEIRLTNGDELGGLNVRVVDTEDGFCPICEGEQIFDSDPDLSCILDQIADVLDADDWSIDDQDDPGSVITIDAGDSSGYTPDLRGEIQHGVDVDGSSGRLLITGSRQDVISYMSDNGITASDDEEDQPMEDEIQEDITDTVSDDHDDDRHRDEVWSSDSDGYYTITRDGETGGVVKVQSGETDQYIAFTVDSPDDSSDRISANSSLFDDHDGSSDSEDQNDDRGFTLIGVYESPDEAAQAVEDRMDVHPDASIDEAVNPYDGMSDDDIIESFSGPVVKRSSDDDDDDDDDDEIAIRFHLKDPDRDSDHVDEGIDGYILSYLYDDDGHGSYVVWGPEGDVIDFYLDDLRGNIREGDDFDDIITEIPSESERTASNDPERIMRFEVDDPDDVPSVYAGARDYGVSLSVVNESHGPSYDGDQETFEASGPESALEGFFYDYLDGKTADPGDFEDFILGSGSDESDDDEYGDLYSGEDREIDDLDWDDLDDHEASRTADVQYDANGNPINDPSSNQDDGPVSSTDIHQEDDGTYSVSISGDDDRDNTNDPQLETYQGGFGSEADAQSWLTQRMMSGESTTASNRVADAPDYHHMYDSEGVNTVDVIPGDHGLTALILRNEDGEYGWEIHTSDDPWGYESYDAGLETEQQARDGAESALRAAEGSHERDLKYDQSLAEASRTAHLVDVQMMQREDGSYYWHLNVKGDDGEVILEDDYSDEDLAMDAAKQAIESSDATPVIEDENGDVVPDEDSDVQIPDDRDYRPEDSDDKSANIRSARTSEDHLKDDQSERAYLFHIDHSDLSDQDMRDHTSFDGVSDAEWDEPDEVFIVATPSAARDVADSIYGESVTTDEMSDASELGAIVESIRDGSEDRGADLEQDVLQRYGWIPEEISEYSISHYDDSDE